MFLFTSVIIAKIVEIGKINPFVDFTNNSNDIRGNEDVG